MRSHFPPPPPFPTLTIDEAVVERRGTLRPRPDPAAATQAGGAAGFRLVSSHVARTTRLEPVVGGTSGATLTWKKQGIKKF